LRDGIDTITDFVPGTDRLDLSALLASLGISRAVARSGGYVQLVDTNSGVSVQINADGSAGAGVLRPLVTLRGRTAAQIDFATRGVVEHAGNLGLHQVESVGQIEQFDILAEHLGVGVLDVLNHAQAEFRIGLGVIQGGIGNDHGRLPPVKNLNFTISIGVRGNAMKNFFSCA
ncbi:MAG TPA: type I secretion C-terminal target domain-containing protein, partial [Candidatus Ozemobacteraceae bacterium]|nr:type I secretion C-terminal target domain-containing protein [Candidatus Ozemobacteraceae bacterium]